MDLPRDLPFDSELTTEQIQALDDETRQRGLAGGPTVSLGPLNILEARLVLAFRLWRFLNRKDKSKLDKPALKRLDAGFDRIGKSITRLCKALSQES